MQPKSAVPAPIQAPALAAELRIVISALNRRLREQSDTGDLTSSQKAVLLRLENDLSVEEIAEVTGVGRETAKSRLRYAMNRLREQLAE